MKKVIAMLFLVGTLISQNSNANENPTILKTVQQSFYAQYPEATQVRFENYQNATIVMFVDNNNKYMAFYNEHGQFTGEGRYLTAQETPRRIIRALDQKLGKVEVEAALEFYPEDDVPYYCAWVCTDKKRILLKVFGSGGIEVIKKETRL